MTFPGVILFLYKLILVFLKEKEKLMAAQKDVSYLRLICEFLTFFSALSKEIF